VYFSEGSSYLEKLLAFPVLASRRTTRARREPRDLQRRTPFFYPSLSRFFDKEDLLMLVTRLEQFLSVVPGPPLQASLVPVPTGRLSGPNQGRSYIEGLLEEDNYQLAHCSMFPFCLDSISTCHGNIPSHCENFSGREVPSRQAVHAARKIFDATPEGVQVTAAILFKKARRRKELRIKKRKNTNVECG
jgi:hypothetical protein